MNTKTIFADSNQRTDYYKLWKENPEEWTPTSEDIACELQLLSLGDWEPLAFKINSKEWYDNKNNLKEYYVPFQPREGILNDRESVLIYGLENDHPSKATGLSQIRKELGYMPMEEDFKYPTEAQEKLTCCKPLFDYFETLGRTFLLSLHQGGHYAYHRDFPFITRNTIRLIGFLGDSTDALEWEVGGNKMKFVPNTFYYVNTIKRHRLFSTANHSDMIVVNIPKTWENVIKIMTVLKDPS